MVLVVNTTNVFATNVNLSDEIDQLTSEEMNKIDKYINDQLRENKIPGVSVVIISGDNCIYKKGFGYSNVEEKKEVSPDTYFEIGSNSKAFTALGIVKLANSGAISITDSIDKFVPWFKMNYKGKEAKITIEQLLNHTSGIPYESIDKIPESESEDALELTVKTLLTQNLSNLPGQHFIYATINYDILGLIIEKVSGQSYEEYMKKEILEPLELNNTYLFKEDSLVNDMAKGYKIGFLNIHRYDAPRYRGNTPAGYFIMNANEMEKWLKIQLGTNNLTNNNSDLINKSHNTKLKLFKNGSTYNNGWFINDNMEVLNHPGNNPNYSSYIILNTKDKVGIAIMANIDVPNINEIGVGIKDILNDKVPSRVNQSTYVKGDKIAVAVISILVSCVLIMSVMVIVVIVQIFQKKRRVNFRGIKSISHLILSIAIIIVLRTCIVRIPQVFFGGVSWRFLSVWAPITLLYAAMLTCIFIIQLCLYILFVNLFKKNTEKSFIKS